jgi:PAS domain S-box-containing protein
VDDAPAAGAARHRAAAGSSRRGRDSLRRRVNRLLVAGLALQLVLVVTVTGATALAAMASLRAVADRATETAAASVLAGMADQQSGLLAFLDAPTEPAPLLLYTQGQQETDIALVDLRAGSTGTPLAGLAARVGSDARSWERWAEGMRMQARTALLPLTDPAAVVEGRHLFSVFRADQSDLASGLEEDASSSVRSTLAVGIVKAAVVVAGSLAVTGLLLLTARRVTRRGIEPLGQLALVAGDIAAGVPVAIPYAGSGDELGELAQALQGWQQASSIRSIVTEQAPVGICRIDAAGRFLSANAALATMLRCPAGELVGRSFGDRLHRDDRRGVGEEHERLLRGTIPGFEVESRWLCDDGSIVWCSLAAAPVPAIGGGSESFVGIVEDVTERRLESERAARIQRRLLPEEQPTLPGYRVAATCLPAQDVAGDFYDWTGPHAGRFDLTIADVMGKGLASALVMATLRTALRATPPELDPGMRVGRVAEAMTAALTDEGLFVTMFHARLDLGSGRLRYVDAGHGYAAVRRADGAMVPLRTGSLPLGVVSGEVFEEGEVRLEPLDTLLAFTDGLVEIGDRTIGLDEIGLSLEGAGDVQDMAGRLLDRVRGQQADDVTVVLLQRVDE